MRSASTSTSSFEVRDEDEELHQGSTGGLSLPGHRGGGFGRLAAGPYATCMLAGVDVTWSKEQDKICSPDFLILASSGSSRWGL